MTPGRFRCAESGFEVENFEILHPDVETSKVMDARFKKIVAGETQTVERKFKPPFDLKPFAKILFSANDFIPTKDRTHGFYRRFDIVRFNRILKPEGIFAASVPKFLPEWICWKLSTAYQEMPGGHVRIFKYKELKAVLQTPLFLCLQL